jgi:predicted nuclease of predicted toxin-antitoxin system
MKIKLDENIPLRVASILANLGHDTDTVPEEGLGGQEDQYIWEAAQKTNRFFITQDLDFSNIQKFIPGTHQGLLILRLRDPGRNTLLQRIETIFKAEDVNQWEGCFVVATDRKIRIRRPR